MDFKFSASNGTAKACQLETEVIQRPRICKELATKYYSYTTKEADEEREHRLPTFHFSIRSIEFARRGKFTVKIIFFDATIGSKNYTICKIDTRSIFATD